MRGVKEDRDMTTATVIAHQIHGTESEVAEKAKRRRFSAQYKVRILAAAERCSKSGELGSLLRREGLYSSHLASWRKQQREGALRALARKRGAKPKKSAEQRELEQLRGENARLRRRLEHAQQVIDVQKKLSELLGIPLQEPPSTSDE
jgi:transposase